MDDKDLSDVARLFTDYSGESRIRETLRHDLLARIEHPAAPPKGVKTMLYGTPRRRLALAASTLVVIMMTVLVIPPLRSWAQDVLRQIGVITLTDEPTYAEKEVERLNNHEPAPTMVPVETDPDQPTCGILEPFDVTEASARVGFPVYEPSYLPQSGTFSLTGRDSLLGSDRIVSRSVYGNSTLPDTLMLMQAKPTDPSTQLWETPDDATATDITINDLPATWIENYPDDETLAHFQSSVATGVNLLIWEQDGYTFLLESFFLPQNQMIQIAESLMAAENVPAEASEPFCQIHFLGREQAGNLTGMPAYEPTYLPDDFYLWSRGRDETRAIYTTYQRYKDGWFEGYEVEDMIHLIQFRTGDETEEIAIGDAPITDAIVNGQPAVWVANWAIGYQPVDYTEEWKTVDTNLLIWEADGYTFMLQAARSQDEMIRIAESLSAE
jgi:hypothetical protein